MGRLASYLGRLIDPAPVTSSTLQLPRAAVTARPVRERGYQLDTSFQTSWTLGAPEEHETNPDLMWPRSIDMFDRMRREDSQVKSVLKAVTLPIMRTGWSLDCTDVNPEVAAFVADDLGLPIKGQPPRPQGRRRDRFSWHDHLRLALLELPFGHSIFEQVYRIDDDGSAHLRKLAWRPPRTISGWDIAPDGGLRAIMQYGTAGRRADVRLPVSRLVAYINEREGGNWAGESLLRAPYKNWIIKDELLRSQAGTVDRNGMGVPVYEASPPPDGYTPDERAAWIAQELDNGLTLTTEFRSGETAGASIPHGAKLTLRGVEGDLPDADKPIRYHDEQIARGVLAHFLNLGTETGSWALGATFADFFIASLQSEAMHIADVTQQHVIDDLVDINWGEDEPAPRLVFDEIGSGIRASATDVATMLTSGVLTLDPELESYMRATYSLPARKGA